MFGAKWRKADKASKAHQLQLLKQQQQEPPVRKQDYFENNCHRTYSCIHCRAHLANHDELISKLFQGNHGRAYLFNKVANIGCKEAVERELLTGLHAVADIYCDSCETTLGWKYEQAFVPSQKYKEGKYIIEIVHMLKENNWDLTSHNTRELLSESDDHLSTGPQNNRLYLSLDLNDGLSGLNNEESVSANCCNDNQAKVNQLMDENCSAHLGGADNSAAIALAGPDSASRASTPSPSSTSLCARVKGALKNTGLETSNESTLSSNEELDKAQEIRIDMVQTKCDSSEFSNELPSLEND